MTDKEKTYVTAVIYVHNCSSYIREFLKKTVSAIDGIFESSDMVFVNDASDDASVDIIKQTLTEMKYGNALVINLNSYHGLEAAMRSGIEYSVGDYVFEFDHVYPDFEPSLIADIFHKAQEGYDIVSAVPDRRAKMSSRIFYRLFSAANGNRYKMRTDSFRIISRRAVNRIYSDNTTIPYRKFAYAASGFESAQVEYVPVEQYRRGSKDSESNYRIDLAVDSFILFTKISFRFSIAMTVLMSLISVFMLGYSLFIYLASQPIEGWTTTILFLSVAFMGLFGILSIVIKYLQLIINLLYTRRSYSIKSIEKITDQ